MDGLSGPRDEKGREDIAQGPNFIIVGAMKAGTESIVGCLRNHPEIWMPEEETHYFDRSRRSPKRPFPSDYAYKRYFDLKRAGDVKAVGEKTPVYMHLPSAINRISHLKDVKIIVVLRDPVERAWSHWKYWKRDPDKFLSILEELKDIKSKPSRKNVLRRGFYDEHMTRIKALFPSNRLLTLIAERVWADPVSHYNQIFKFLGVSQIAGDPKVVGPKPKKRNVSPVPGGSKAKAKLSAEARGTLQRIYHPHNRILFDLLGYSISEWGSPQMGKVGTRT
ncbi:hypothetical protein AAMO2058_001128900 [Amorphochlora amoebiformis]